MDLSINQAQTHLVETLRELCQQKIKPYYLAHEYSNVEEFDWHMVRLLGELNLICPNIPEEYGGLGLDMFTISLLMEELSAVCPALSAIVQTNIHAVQPLLLAGTEQQKEAVLPKLTGPQACLCSFAVTEPTGGSDINSMTSLAEKTADGFILNGQKDYILNAPEAEYMTVFAFTDPLHKRSSLRCFIVPRNTEGLSIGRIKNLVTLDYARTAEVVFENVHIDPQMALKGQEPFSGYLLLTQALDIGRALTGATSVGIARAAYQLAYDFASRRTQYDKTILNHQAIAHSLVNMAAKIEMARLMTWKACWLIDKGDDFTVASAMAKLSASTIALQVTSRAAEILGARALLKGSEMDRLFNNARMLATIEGTNHIQRNIISSLL